MEASESKARWREALLVAPLALVLNLAGNGRVSLWDRDEPRYAGTAREMRNSGEYVDMMFNGAPYYHKPVLFYWLVWAAYDLAGDNPFGARLVPALSGAATCLLVLAWGRRMLGDRAALWAALILATAPIMVVESKLATMDTFLTLCVVAAQWALWELARAPSWRSALSFWVAMAVSVLTKGPMGPAIVASALPLSWWWGGPTAFLRRLKWLPGLALCAALLAPWCVAIYLASHGDFYRVMVGRHVLHRMTHAMESHGGFPGYYVAMILGMFYPWAALLPSALVWAWARRRQDPNLGFLLGWTLGPLILLEGASTKLLHYYLPAYPAAALLVAWLLDGLARGELSWAPGPLRRVSFVLLRWIGGAWVVLLTAGVYALPAPMKWPCLASALAVAVGTVLAHRRLGRGEFGRGTAVLAATWSAVALVAGLWLAPSAQPYRLAVSVGRALREVEARGAAVPVLASFGPPSVVIEVGHPLPHLFQPEKLVRESLRVGTLAAALGPADVWAIEADPRVRLTMLQKIEGFDVEKFRNLTLRLALIEPVDRGGAGIRAEAAHTRQGPEAGTNGSGSEQTSVPAQGGRKPRALALAPRAVSITGSGPVP
jgi:4-amino-4-deoxy-L-arabinose transferase-like glycosyltransferase